MALLFTISKRSICCPAASFIPSHHLFGHLSLRKHAYSNIWRILLPKNENFQMKNSGSFHISALNIDCGTR